MELVRYVPSHSFKSCRVSWHILRIDLSLCVSGVHQEAFDEGKKTWDGWSGRDVGLGTDQKVLEMYSKANMIPG